MFEIKYREYNPDSPTLYSCLFKCDPPCDPLCKPRYSAHPKPAEHLFCITDLSRFFALSRKYLFYFYPLNIRQTEDSSGSLLLLGSKMPVCLVRKTRRVWMRCRQKKQRRGRDGTTGRYYGGEEGYLFG